MSGPSRVDELRRRIDDDPVPAAFVQLADEYRSTDQLEDAASVAREGLARHPGDASIRVALSRVLMRLEEFDAARSELESVLKDDPENFGATLALGELTHPAVTGALEEAAETPETPGMDAAMIDFQKAMAALDAATPETPLTHVAELPLPLPTVAQRAAELPLEAGLPSSLPSTSLPISPSAPAFDIHLIADPPKAPEVEGIVEPGKLDFSLDLSKLDGPAPTAGGADDVATLLQKEPGLRRGLEPGDRLTLDTSDGTTRDQDPDR